MQGDKQTVDSGWDSILGRVERGCPLDKVMFGQRLNEVREMMYGCLGGEFLQTMILETRAWLISLRNSKEGLGAGFSE